MKWPPARFWKWFSGFAGRLPDDDLPEEMLDELLEQLQRVDSRFYFELQTTEPAKELIITASGDVSAFAAIRAFVDTAPPIADWSIVALKPAQGFAFTHCNNGIELDASKLWFLSLKSAADPQALGVCLGVLDADFVLEHQSVDTAYTILETGIGERACGEDIQYVEIADLPADPEANGYLPLPMLPKYLAFHKHRNAK